MSAETSSSELTPFAIMGALRGKIAPVPTPLLYRLGILLCAGVMLVLPLVYASLTVATGYVVYYHAMNHVFEPHGRSGIMLFAAVYLAPLVAGCLLVLFMIKPFFTLQRRRSVPLFLSPEKQPLLFAFVSGVAEAVGAPMPARIAVDCDANASASFDGFFGFFTGRLVLTIGLPLADKLSLPQLAGVIAHELGHFTQGGGMRFSFLAMNATRWFADRVNSEDTLDEWVKLNLMNDSHWLITLCGWLATMMIGLARLMLKVVYWVGLLLIGFLLRQMEYHADLHESRLVGVKNFGETQRALPALGLASGEGTKHAIMAMLHLQILPENLPEYIGDLLASVPPEVHKKIERHMTLTKTGPLDTHPAQQDRIAAVNRDGAKGIYALDGPGRALFRDFPRLCKVASHDLYARWLGNDLHGVKMLKLSEFRRAIAEASEGSARGS